MRFPCCVSRFGCQFGVLGAVGWLESSREAVQSGDPQLEANKHGVFCIFWRLNIGLMCRHIFLNGIPSIVPTRLQGRTR